MQRRLTINVPWALAAGLFVILATLLVWLTFPGAGDSRGLGTVGGAINRLAQDSWNNGEIYTDSSEPVVFYDKKVSASKDYKTLFVTFTATSDQHQGALNLSCTIDGNNCDAYGNPVVVQWNQAADWHDNSVTQSWCIAKRKGEVMLFLDNRDGGGGLSPIPKISTEPVYFEHATVTIDAVNIAGCGPNHFISVGGETRPITHGP